MSTMAKDRRTSPCTGVITVGPNGSLPHPSILDSVTLGTGVDVQPHNETSGQRLSDPSGSTWTSSDHPRRDTFMNIGLGTLVLILVILAIVYFARRA